MSEQNRNGNQNTFGTNRVDFSQTQDFNDIPQETPIKMNPFVKLVKIVTAPSEAARAIKSKPDILLPLFLVVLSPLLPLLLNVQEYKDMIVGSFANIPQYKDMAAEELRKIADFSAITGMVGGPIMTLVFWFIGALVMFGLIKMLGGECRYKQVLSLQGYVTVFSLISSLISGLVMHFSGSGFAKISYTSLSVLFPNLEAGFLSGFLSGIEIFSIISLLVSAIGLTIISGLDKKKVYALLIVLFVIGLLFTGVSLAMSAKLTGFGA